MADTAILTTIALTVAVTGFLFIAGFLVFAGPAFWHDVKRALNEAKDSSDK